MSNFKLHGLLRDQLNVLLLHFLFYFEFQAVSYAEILLRDGKGNLDPQNFNPPHMSFFTSLLLYNMKICDAALNGLD